MEKQIYDLLKAHGRRITVKKGAPITGSNPRYVSDVLYLLAEGISALTTLSKSGEERVYLYYHGPRLIGFNRHFVGPKEQPIPGPEFSNVAKTNCILYEIQLSQFFDLLRTHEELVYFFLKTVANNFNDALSHFYFAQEESATVRLCHLLLEISRPFQNKRIVPMFYSHTELAKYLDCHPVTVSRIMPRLKDSGYISKSPEGIVIENADGLIHLIETGSNFKY